MQVLHFMYSAFARVRWHFAKKFSVRSGKKVGLSYAALALLQSRQWDGNVRELEHTIERAVALTPDGSDIRPENCLDDASAPRFRRPGLPVEGIHLPGFLNAIEKEYVEDALERTGGNQTRSAALLQIPVHALRHLLQKHNLR